jgi:hypothetical protein
MHDKLQNSNLCIQDLFLLDKGVVCISELESYAEDSLSAIWDTCVRQVSSDLPEQKEAPGPAEIGSWG